MHLKGVIRFFKYLTIFLVLFLVLVLTGINLPFVQRIISEKVNGLMQEKNLPVHVDKIKIVITGRIGLSGVEIIKEQGDTIVYAGNINVSVKIIPLIFHKVRVMGIAIENTTVNLTADSETGKLDIISIFSQGEKSDSVKSTSGKPWEISVGSFYLRNVKFTMNDSVNGIHTDQSIKEMTVVMDKFSLTGHQIFASYVSIKDLTGSIYLGPSQKTESEPDTSDIRWEFRLKDSDLQRIDFTLMQPGNQQEFNISGGVIQNALADLGSQRISVARLNLESPLVKILSSPQDIKEPDTGSGNTVQGFPGNWDISGNDLKITGGEFQTGPFPGSVTGKTADSVFSVTSLSAYLSDLKLSSSSSNLSLKDLSFLLGNGLKMERGELIFKSDTSGTSIESTLKTSDSHISLSVESRSSLSDLIRSYSTASFNLKIDETEISASDIFRFLPDAGEGYSMKQKKNLGLALKCNISGNTDLFNINDLDIKTRQGASLFLSGNIQGINHPSSATCSLSFKTGAILPANIRELLTLISSGVEIPDFDPVSAEGFFEGRIMKPEFNLALNDSSGNIHFDGKIDIDQKEYELRLKSSGFNLGKLTGINDLGIFTGKLDVSGKDFIPSKMLLNAILEVDTVVFKGYHYKEIIAGLNGQKGVFNYNLKAEDPSFLCDITGTFNLSDSLTGGKLRGLISLDAGAVNLIKETKVSANLNAELNKTISGMDGFASLTDLKLEKSNHSGQLNNLEISFRASEKLIEGKASSDFLKADGYYEGSVEDIKKVLKEGSFRGIAFLDSAISNKFTYIDLMNKLSISLEASYHPLIGLLVSDTVFSYNKVFLRLIKDTTDIAKAEMSVDRFNLGKSRGYNASITLERSPEKSGLVLKADSLRYGNVSLTGLGADISSRGDSAKVSLLAGDSKTGIIYDVEATAYKNGNEIRMATSSDQWIINGYKWKITPGDFLVLDKAGKDLAANLHLKNDESSIDFYGRKSGKLTFECVNLGLKMLLIPGMNSLGYNGEFTGKLDYSKGTKTEIVARMDINRMIMNDIGLGNMRISGSYTSDTLGNIEGSVNAGMNDSSALRIDVKYGKNASQRSLISEFNKLPLIFIGALSAEYISDLQGTIGGRIELKPVDGKQTINGEVRVNDLGLRLIPVNAKFYLPGDVIKITANRLLFTNFTVLDSLHNRLDLNGSINISDPRNILADLQVTSNRIQIMNTTAKDNPEFNGSIFVNTRINLSGPLQNPSVEGSIVLAGGTVINYRYTENLAVSETQKLVTFASLKEDKTVAEKKKLEINRISKSPVIEASLEIDPNTLFNFEISRGYDIGVHITGGGFLTYSMTPGKDIDLTGLYEIREGNSELKIPGWPRKDFLISPGSFVKWDGKVDDPDLRIETTTKVRGSYVNPIDQRNREVNFIVYMKLAGRLSQIDILFDVRSEDQYLTSVLNTMSTDERMRQAINLLIFGSVQLPNAGASSDYMTQQINQFWESQINSFTRSAVKFVDFSLGIDSYKDPAKAGAEHTSVSYQVKKDLFKDRGSVMVSGRMNDNDPSSQQSTAVIENFIFEYALDPNRTNYLKVYRQQNYEDLLEGEVIKSGIGFIYRKSYDKVSDIWRREKKTKKDK